ncbi:MAG TPA: NAD(P)-dependent oxidoreductase [Gaiellaceae bacterium]|nr:NAD(P)-dependent oxidoreductase [Gaiellaceae bacterium]
MSRHVLVSGGAGFIGSHLVERLVAAGDRVSVIDDLSRGRRAWIHPEADLHELDLGDVEATGRRVRRIAPDVVVHLAAMHFIPSVDDAPEVARKVNVEGTRNLLAALASSPPRLLLFASTAAVYPDRSGPIAESCPPDPVDLYGETKLEGERLVTDFGARTGARCIVARIFNVVGRRETNPHVVAELVAQLRSGRRPVRLGNLASRRDYTDVLDVSDALHRLLSGPDGADVFNVGSGRSVSVSDLVELCERILGGPLDVEVDPDRLRAEDRAELVADSRLLRETTGWDAERSLESTLADLLVEPHGPRS